ncbi:MAG: hypothetical protein EXX96DRAFT_566858 [Benjaminiella poitrasii]|nr:MAG: hypothetical protein EXX96DRAFT_566858 [Benjaminiella poitrasii]
MKRPRCFGFPPNFVVSKEDLQKIKVQPYLCTLTAEDWSNESALINAIPIESFSRFSYRKIKKILNDFLSAVASHASQTFVRVYAEKCREFYKSNQGDTLLLKAARDRSSVINTQKLQNQIEQEKQSAKLEGELNGVKLSRLGGQKYSRELDKVHIFLVITFFATIILVVPFSPLFIGSL